MRRVGDLVAIDDEPERAVRRVERPLGDALDDALGAAAIVDEVGDRADHEAVVAREDLEVGHARHRAVVAHDFADDRRRREAGQPREVAARLGVAGAHQHAARLRHHGKDVARLHEVARAGLGGHRHATVRARSAAEIPVVTPFAASIDTVKLVPCPERLAATMAAEPESPAAFLFEREAYEAAGVLGHEVDRLRP